jgi:RNA polymerase sigma-70 factor (ECF subfamily)
MLDEKKLVKECLRNSLAAQKQLYELYADAMLGLCYRYTKSLHDAQEVLQVAFIKVFEHLGQYREEGDLGAWIRRIMVNTAINYLKRKPSYQSDLAFKDTYLHPVEPEMPDMQINMKDIVSVIRQLPPGYQTIFNLIAIEDYSHAEAAKILGIKESTSRTQYMRARNLLVRWLTKHFDDSQRKQYGR